MRTITFGSLLVWAFGLFMMGAFEVAAQSHPAFRGIFAQDMLTVAMIPVILGTMALMKRVPREHVVVSPKNSGLRNTFNIFNIAYNITMAIAAIVMVKNAGLPYHQTLFVISLIYVLIWIAYQMAFIVIEPSLP